MASELGRRRPDVPPAPNVILTPPAILDSAPPLVRGREDRVKGEYVYKAQVKGGQEEIVFRGRNAAVASMFFDLPSGGIVRRPALEFLLGTDTAGIRGPLNNVTQLAPLVGARIVPVPVYDGYRLLPAEGPAEEQTRNPGRKKRKRRRQVKYTVRHGSRVGREGKRWSGNI